MALSGNIESKFHGGSTGGYYVGIDWVVNSQSVSGNSSSVTATTYIRASGSGYTISSSATKNISLTINGSSGSSTNTVGLTTNQKKTLYTRTITVGHDSSGNKTCSFSTTVGVNVTLSGTYYGNVSASGSGVFNKINLNSAPFWTNDNLRIDNDRTNKYIASNVSSVTIQPAAIDDNENNIIYYDLYRYVNDQRHATLGTGMTSTSGWADNISSFGEGTKIQYLLQADDGQYSAAGDRWSNWIIKNTLSEASFTAVPSIPYSSSERPTYTFSWSTPSNTNGSTSFSHHLLIDGITVYNSSVGNVRSAALTVWNGANATPTGPYILRSDLVNYINANAGTDKEMNMTARIRTGNDYGVSKDRTSSFNVNLRTAPSTPASITVSTNKSLSTALVAVAGADYWVPNGSRLIRVDWAAATDTLTGNSTGITYDLYGKHAGESYVLLAGGLTGTSRDVVLPAVTSSRNYNFQVIAKASYGNASGARESSAIVLHYYNPPTITFGAVTRTENSLSVAITTSTNSSIAAVNFTTPGTRTYTHNGQSAVALTASPQTVTRSSLVDSTAYSISVTATDNSGLSGNTLTKSVSIPAYVPIVSIRDLGLGVNALADATYKFKVGGSGHITTNLRIDGDIILTPSSGAFPGTTNGSIFGSDATLKNGITFQAASGSNDPGAIYHETSSVAASTNRGVLHLCPSDDADNANDYVSIHGSNDPENIKLYTGGNGWFAGEVSTSKLTGRGASASWTSIDVGGNKGGYTGFNFTDNDYAIMVRSSDGLSGLYNTSVGAWVYQFTGGTGASVKLNVGGVSATGASYFGGALGQNAGSVSDFNSILTEGQYFFGSGSTIANAPYTGGIYGKLIVTVSDGGTHNNSSNWIWQTAYTTAGLTYLRRKVNASGWSSWAKITTDETKTAGALWTGGHFMVSSQTIYPSKALSDCLGGWVLAWSDFNEPSTSNNFNWVYTYFPKDAALGVNTLFSVPNGETSGVFKALYFANDRITGHDTNNATAADRDVVLRYVFEY